MFNEIEIAAQNHDEPPGKKRHFQTHQLTFSLNEGVLILSEYRISKSKVNHSKEVIPKYLVDSLSNLLKTPVSTFNIKNGQGDKDIYTLDLDSLEFCQSFNDLKRIVMGGFIINVKVKNTNIRLLEFEFDTTYPDSLDLQKFLTLYPLLQNRLPEKFPGAGLFDNKFLMEKVFDYQEVIQCEDYYYHEFVNAHPERTPQQNRTREGWNFEGYLKNRKGN
ncbi:MAG: hypothetical protein RIC35_09480 [Marinoscillum sp.]